MRANLKYLEQTKREIDNEDGGQGRLGDGEVSY